MMTRRRVPRRVSLARKYPPSEPCSCAVCTGYCARPGWWTVEEAEVAIQAGYAGRMMLELAPERCFGVLAPAFRGCEGSYAIQEYQHNGCTFFTGGLCELHGSGHMPLECRFCHHSRVGLGAACHADIERGWNTPAAQALVARWQRITGFWKRKTNQFMRSKTP